MTEQSGFARVLAGLRAHRGLIVPVGFVLLLTVLLVPLPPVLLDILISLNISLSVIVLLTTIYLSRALDFSVFPSLLLGTTLFRLVLNIASTRLILTADASSPAEAIGVAGQVISAFGSFVAGDSLFVGVVLFLIIMIVQFMVVTKGAGRISEVAARFTLDAMPGKQMAIDSDLSAGLITEDEARARREEVAREADFFGAMDGASKFVKGDTIAGMIITVINILGGFAVGAIERGWPAGQTAQVFTKLTIGDGLTSQIPSFVISIASALIVTRTGSKDDLGEELTGQIISQPRGLAITACFLAVLAMTPLPTLPLLGTAVGIGTIALALRRASKLELTRIDEEPDESEAADGPPVESLLQVDVLELEVGYGLVPLIDVNQGGTLLDRISAVRRQLAVETGLVMPPVRIRDNMQLGPGEYRIKIRGNPVASGELQPERLLAMDSGIALGKIEGIPTREPAFGLEAWWIEPSLQSRAESLNYTVVDPTSVLATHLTELVRQHADELLTREEVQNLLEGLKERAPKLVDETVPGIIKVGELQKVLQRLLRERVPVRDLETILEVLADWAPKTKDIDVLVEYVRNGLKRTICQAHAVTGENGKSRIVCVTIDPALEDIIESYIDRSGGVTTINMPSRVATDIGTRIARAVEHGASTTGVSPVVITSPRVRAVVRDIIEPFSPTTAVLAYNEVLAGVEIESVKLVGPEPESQAA
ncbi:MAG: flagellar biosynthesis protein FlhA [Planctomycetota bacterium]|nr:MAG: flagellar biosynthesis protein FlhA [Planctomycetota bacterium]